MDSGDRLRSRNFARPQSSAVRKSWCFKVHQILRRISVSKGGRPRWVPSRSRPIVWAMRMAMPVRVHTARGS